MPQQTHVVTFDDLDWAEGRQVPSTTERIFSVGGKSYHLYLTDQHATEFDADFEAYVTCGEAVASGASAAPRARSKTGSSAKRSGSDAPEMRVWARNQGMEISDRGKVPAGVSDAFYAAHPDKRPAEAA